MSSERQAARHGIVVARHGFVSSRVAGLKHILVATVAVLGLAATQALAATAPLQPKTGPGSVLDATGEVVKRAVGRASNSSYVYHMASAPAEKRSVVVLFHAWGAVNPVVYGGMIDHLARRGHLVVFPNFQTVGKTRPIEATEFTTTLVKEALAALEKDPQANPDLSKVIYLGHSVGAVLALNLAAGAKQSGLPAPKLIYGLMPGGIASDAKSRGILLADLSTIGPETAIVTMVGDKEFQAADRSSKRFFREATNVLPNNKLFLRAPSDDHGFPALSATLASAASPKEGYDMAAIKVEPDPGQADPKKARFQPRPRSMPDMFLTGEQTVLVNQYQRNVVDALDYLAYWRSFDMVATAALSGTDMATVKADPTLVDMGRWSDGWPMRRMSADVPKPEAPAATSSGTPSATAPVTAPMIQTKQPVTRRQVSRQAR